MSFYSDIDLALLEPQQPPESQEPKNGDAEIKEPKRESVFARKTFAKKRDRPDEWNAVAAAANALFLNPDYQAIRANLAAVVSHQLTQWCPAWLLDIAPPGSGKTEIDDAIDAATQVWPLDELTVNTFLSGQISQIKTVKPASLLHRIGPSGIVLVKDLSSMMSNPKNFAVIMGQLRRIHDGSFRREFGTQENIPAWTGRITLLASVTPDIDTHLAMMNKMGPRFVSVRWPRAGGIETGKRVSKNRLLERKTFQAAVKNLLQFATQRPAPDLSDERETALSAAGELIALARGTVPRERQSREALTEAIVESNTRMVQELEQIARGSAMLEGRSMVNDTDVALALRVGRDTIPRVRFLVIDAIRAGRPVYGIKGIARAVIGRALEDLELTDVVTTAKDAGWGLTDTALDLAEKSRLFEGATQ